MITTFPGHTSYLLHKIDSSIQDNDEQFESSITSHIYIGRDARNHVFVVFDKVMLKQPAQLQIVASSS